MATEKEQVQEFLSIVGKSLHQYVESIDFDALSAAKKLILDAEAKGGRLHVTGIGKPGHVSGYAASLSRQLELQPTSFTVPSVSTDLLVRLVLVTWSLLFPTPARQASSRLPLPALRTLACTLLR